MNVAHTEDDLANPRLMPASTASRTRAVGFQNFLDAGFRHLPPLRRRQRPLLLVVVHVEGRERNAGWRIDYFLCLRTPQAGNHRGGDPGDVMGSDHCPVSVELDEKKLAKL